MGRIPSTELPEEIIHHILSFLPTKEATKASVLSKAWLNAWRTRPALNFDNAFTSCFFLQGLASKGNQACRKKKSKGRLKHIISTLLRYKKQKIPLQTFRLTTFQYSDCCTLVDRCVELAVEQGVRNLEIDMVSYSLSPSVFESKSLVELRLTGCNVQNEERIVCHNLKRLWLCRVYIDQDMFDITRSCPLIEILNVIYCRGVIKNFKVNDLCNLKQLNAKLLPGQSVEVEATPNLELVICTGREEGPIPWLNLRASKYENLKSLLLCGVGLDDNSFINLAKKFPNLEVLSIQCCQHLQRIKISSHSLKEIQLVGNNRLKEALLGVRSIVLFEYEGEGKIMPKLSFTSASAGKWESRIKLRCDQNVDTSWFLKLKEFLKKLNHSEVCLTIYFYGDVAFNEDEITNNVPFSEPEEIREFCLKAVQKFSLPSALAILDGIFWTCHPRTITHWHWLDYRFTKLLYEMLILKTNPRYSNPDRVKVWQHDLKDVTDIEIFQNGISPVKRGRVDHSKTGRPVRLPKYLNSMNFGEVLQTQKDGWTIIGFNLEWRTSEVPPAVKRLKT